LVCGPRIDPRAIEPVEGMEAVGYVHDLFRTLACCDLAVVQGGLTTTMELVANRRPFISIPLRNHFEQNHHVVHRLRRYGAQAPPEEFLYVACLHEGTGVEKPDFIAVVDAEEGRIVNELPMPNVGDELHHYGWNRCSSACHGPDRSHLIVPGFRSSRIHIVDV